MKLPRVRFRFGLRALLIAIAIAAVGSECAARFAAQARTEVELVAELKQHGFLAWHEPRCAWLFGTRSQPGFWREWLGDDIFDVPHEIIGRAGVFDTCDPIDDDLTSAIPLLRQLPERFTLTVCAGSVCPGDIDALKRIPNLERYSIQPDSPNAPHRLPDFRHWDPFRHMQIPGGSDNRNARDLEGSRVETHDPPHA